MKKENSKKQKDKALRRDSYKMNYAKAKELSELWKWVTLGLTVLFGCISIIFIKEMDNSKPLIFWISAGVLLAASMLLVTSVYKTKQFQREISIFIFVWLIFKETGYSNAAYLFLPLMAILFSSICFTLRSKYSILLSWVLTGIWFFIACKTPFNEFHWTHYILVSSTLFSLILYTVNSLIPTAQRIMNADLILCSYSGNTAHYSDIFIQGLQDAGAKVNLHRFHYYSHFKPELTGDALIVSFPVAGWKPPWTLIVYLLKDLPFGHGKPAFILYSCAGGPENSGLIPWLIMTMKGYRVMGRAWGIYPINVPTFRLGTKKAWKFLDTLLPQREEMQQAFSYGREFALGKPCGLPMVFYPFPLWIAGLILENNLINILYLIHVWRRKCVKCGSCIRYCPAERLSFGKNGFPTARGTCTLCMGCVNFCPNNAIHLFGWTEYGQQYKSKFYNFAVRGTKRPSGK